MVDAVILAIGSSPITINLEGMDKLWHVSAPEVLRHEVCPKGKVAVIGGVWSVWKQQTRLRQTDVKSLFWR